MPKTAASDLQSNPVVISLNQCLSKLTEMRSQREDLVKRLTTCLQGGDTRAALFAVFRGERTKEDVFGELLGRLALFEEELNL